MEIGNISITNMKSEHIPSLCLLEQQCFSSPWSQSSFEEYLNNPDCIFLVALYENEVAGYIGMYSVLDEGNITNVAVFENYRRLGIGRMLIDELIQRSKQKGLSFLTLEVRKSNNAAISLYKSCGFNEVGQRKEYYSKPTEDAVLMTVQL